MNEVGEKMGSRDRSEKWEMPQFVEIYEVVSESEIFFIDCCAEFQIFYHFKFISSFFRINWAQIHCRMIPERSFLLSLTLIPSTLHPLVQ